MKKKQPWMLLTLVLVVCIAVIGIGTASPTATVAVDPPEVKDLEPSASFSVNITVADVVTSEAPPICNGLYGWSINMTFDPAVLNVADVTEGPFLQEVAETVSLPVRINNTVGTVFTGAIIKPPFGPQGATGSGVLVTITFTVKGRGMTTLDLQSSKLRTVVAGQNWEIENVNTINGKFTNVATLPIELIAAVIVAVAIGGVIAVFFYRKRKTITE